MKIEEVIDAANKLVSSGKPVTVAALTFLLFPGVGNKDWTPVTSKIRRIVQRLKKKDQWPFELKTRNNSPTKDVKEFLKAKYPGCEIYG